MKDMSVLNDSEMPNVYKSAVEATVIKKQHQPAIAETTVARM